MIEAPVWVWIVLAALSNYTAAHMLSQDGDDGPFNLFKTIRDKVGTGNWIGKGLHCFRCTSFWGGLIASCLMILAIQGNSACQFLLCWGSISAIAVFAWRYFG